MESILEVHDLQIKLKKDKNNMVPAVDNVSFSMKKGKTLGIIGESGSGKSLTCMGIMGLLDRKIWDIKGSIFLEGNEIDISNRKSMSGLCGNKIALIIQNPMSAFNPVITIGAHFYETMNKSGRKKSRKEIEEKAAELLQKMHIRDPHAVLRSYAFQLSGGMLQRIMIALALAVEPDILIADEPTTALDLSVRNEILKILKELQKQYKMTILIVSHDLSVIRELSDDIAVMYAGNFVEYGTADEILKNPEHPYTKGLFMSRPAFSKDRLIMMEGQPPALEERGKGCGFYPRCPVKTEECKKYGIQPELYGDRHVVNCMKIKDGRGKNGFTDNK